ncbi:MAG: choice-of-anchor D domain-containing protein [Terriglobales bacterium]
MRPFPLVAGLLCCLALAPAWAQELHCQPCWHNFAKVEVGDSRSFSVQLSNTGHQTLRITSKSKQGSEFSFGKFPLPVSVQPGASVELPLIFKPTAKGYAAGVMTLVSTALDPSLTIHLDGTGVYPELKVTPTTLNFGNVAVGSSASLQATLTASNAAVTISSDQSTSSEFAILGLNLPVTIPAGQDIPVTVQFTPSSSGTASAKAGFIGNAANSPTIEQLTGTGVAPASHSVDLSWDTGAENIVGYNVYRGTVQGGPYEQINTALDSSTNYTDSTVVSGTTYYYVTTEVNTLGEESGYSNVAKAVIPST